MADHYDPVPDLARLLDAALRTYGSALPYVDRLAEGLGLESSAGPETAERLLLESLGLKACGDPVGTVTDLQSQSPRTVTRDGRHLVIPALRLDAEGCAVLRQIINNEAAELAAGAEN